MLLRNTSFVRPIEQPTAEAYRHAVPGGRPASGGNDCLQGGQRQCIPGMGEGRQLVIFRLLDLGAPGALPSSCHPIPLLKLIIISSIN